MGSEVDVTGFVRVRGRTFVSVDDLARVLSNLARDMTDAGNLEAAATLDTIASTYAGAAFELELEDR